MLNKKLLGSVSSLPQDDNFENVTLLLNGDGTNGAQNNTFLDSSTNNFTITRNGNTTQGSFSPYGNLWSNYFDGNGDYLTVADNAAFEFGNGNFTIECWIYMTAGSGTSRCIVAKSNRNDGSGAGSFVVQISGSNKLNMLFDKDTTGGVWDINVEGTTNVLLNTWNHIAVTRSGTTFTAWLNGVSEVTATSSITLADNPEVLTIATLGYTSGTFVSFFTGYISNLRLVKGTAVYTSAFTPNTTPLTAITNTSLLTCQSNRFRDASSNNFTISVFGNTSVQRFSPFEPTAPYSTSVIGGSGYFDGSGDWLGFTDSSNNLDLGGAVASIELWAWFNDLSGATRQLVVKSGGAGSGSWSTTDGFEWQLRADNGIPTLAYNTSGNQGTVTSSTSVVVNSWNHIAVATDASNNISLYLNGVRVGTGTNAITKPTNRTLMRIANDIDGNIFTGYISDIRFIKGSGAYNPTSTTITVPTAPLTAVTNTQLLTRFQNAGIPDLAMQNNLETVGNAQVSTSVKKYGTGSLAFDNAGDYLIIPPSPNLQIANSDFTLEFWVYFLGTPTSEFSRFFLENINGGYTLFLNNTDLGYYNRHNIAGDLTATWSPSASTWYHVAITRSGSTVRAFINGTQIGSGTANNNVTYGGSIVIGGTPGISAESVNGYMDDIRITKGLARYTANFTPPAANLPTY